MLETNKQKLIEFIKTEGKEEFTWADLAKKFNIKEGESIETRAKAANDIWRSYQKKQNKLIEDFHAKAKVSKIKEWQNAEGKWLKSIEYQNTAGIDLRVLKDDLVKDIREYEYPKFKLEHSNYNQIVAILNIFDAHIDKLTLKTETGYGSTIENNISIFTKVFDEMLTTAKAFSPELLIFPINGDFFNTNDSRGTTKRGTPQDNLLKHHDAYKVGLNILRNCIDKCSQVSKVIVPIIRGNHDEDAIYYLSTTLEALYEGNTNVVINGERKSRKYVEYGKNLFGFAHGDLEKPIELPLIMAEEQKEAWSNTDYRFWFLGDKHHYNTYQFRGRKDFIGCQVNYLRSISPTDEWHQKSGYIGVPKTADLFLFDYLQGKKANFSFNV